MRFIENGQVIEKEQPEESKNCDQRFESNDRNQKIFKPSFSLKKKNDKTS